MNTPRLRALVERGVTSPPREAAEQERCELCGAPLFEEHRHVWERTQRDVFCACRACAVLFDHGAAGGERYRLIPARRTPVDDVALDPLRWAALRIPVDLAFFVRDESGAVTAYYPSPAGTIESLLPLDAWSEIENGSAAVAAMRPDVEALLVNRLDGAQRAWIVGIDRCYRLVALFRTTWSGMRGGDALWAQTRRFFDELGGAVPSRT